MMYGVVPYIRGLGRGVGVKAMVVTLDSLLTVTSTGADWPGANVASPEYCATTGYGCGIFAPFRGEPGNSRVVNVTVPPLNVNGPISVNVPMPACANPVGSAISAMFPVGVPVAGGGVTVTVKFAALPCASGASGEA